LTQQPKISFKVTLIPTETEVISDEALHKKLTDKTSLQGDADNDETQSMEHPHDNSMYKDFFYLGNTKNGIVRIWFHH